MSRQRKMANKRRYYIKHAKSNGHEVELTGERGGRTKKLHTKKQVYPKAGR